MAAIINPAMLMQMLHCTLLDAKQIVAITKDYEVTVVCEEGELFTCPGNAGDIGIYFLDRRVVKGKSMVMDFVGQGEDTLRVELSDP